MFPEHSLPGPRTNPTHFLQKVKWLFPTKVIETGLTAPERQGVLRRSQPLSVASREASSTASMQRWARRYCFADAFG